MSESFGFIVLDQLSVEIYNMQLKCILICGEGDASVSGRDERRGFKILSPVLKFQGSLVISLARKLHRVRLPVHNALSRLFWILAVIPGVALSAGQVGPEAMPD